MKYRLGVVVETRLRIDDRLIKSLLQRGSPRGFLFEEVIENFFEDLNRSDGVGRDFVSSDGTPVEVRTVRANGGISFLRSSNMGVGRKPNMVEFYSEVREKHFIIGRHHWDGDDLVYEYVAISGAIFFPNEDSPHRWTKKQVDDFFERSTRVTKTSTIKKLRTT